MKNEIFGPILPVVTVKSLDDAIRFHQRAAQAAVGVPVHQVA